MKKLLLLSLAAISLHSQTLNPAVPAPISFTLANTDPTGSCANPSVFYFNYINSRMWGCQVVPNALVGAWTLQNPSVGGGVTSVNGNTGTVVLAIPTDNSQLTNNAGYATAAQVPGLSAVTSVNGLTGSVNVAVPTLLSQLTNDLAFITAANAPVLSVNGLTGAVTLPSANNYQTVKVNGVAVTQRAKLEVNAGANTTITPTDNGTDTTTLTIDTVGGGGGGGLPDPGANGLVKRTALNTTVAATAGTDYYSPGHIISDADLPASITSDITGNAATAAALKTAPTGCAGGQFIQQIGANGVPVACGTASNGGPSVTTGTTLPVTGNCTSSSVNGVYVETGINAGNASNNSGNRMFVCSSFNGGFSWVQKDDIQVNVMSFGCKADGSTNDQACFQNAVNFANTLNNYTGSWSPQSSEVYIPNGRYAIGSSVVLPRSAVSPSSSFPKGTVNIIGESSNGVLLKGTGSSAAWFPGGTGTSIFAGMFQWATACPGNVGCSDNSTLFKSVGQKIEHISFIPPAVTNTGSIYYKTWGTRSTTAFEAERLEEADFEDLKFYDSNTFNPWSIYIGGDALGGTIKDIFCDPNQGTGTINFETVCVLTDTDWYGNTANEEAGWQFGLIDNISAGNGAGGWSMAFQGRGNHTAFSNFHCDGALGKFPAPWALVVADPSYPGTFTSTPGKGGSQCYAFINSWAIDVSNMSNEGKAPDPEFLLQNVQSSEFRNIAPAAGRNEGISGFVMGDGIDLISSTNNVFNGMPQTAFIYQSFSGDQYVSAMSVGAGGSGYTSSPTVAFHIAGSSPFCLTTPKATANISGGAVTSYTITNGGACPGSGNGGGAITATLSGGGGTGATANVTAVNAGAVLLSVDSNSRNNSFVNVESMGTTDISLSDPTTNFVQWCDSTTGANGTCGPDQTIGFLPGFDISPGTGTKPTCASATRGALWTVRGASGAADHVQACLQTGVGTTVAWTQIF